VLSPSRENRPIGGGREQRFSRKLGSNILRLTVAERGGVAAADRFKGWGWACKPHALDQKKLAVYLPGRWKKKSPVRRGPRVAERGEAGAGAF